MIYRVTHTTEYVYSNPVSLSHDVVRMRPREHGGQTCRWHELSITPAVSAKYEMLDYFGNNVAWVSLQEPHIQLVVEARSEVEVRLALRPDPSHGASWETAAQILKEPANREVASARQFCFDSRYVERSPVLASYALPLFTPGRPLLEGVLDLTEQIHRDFKYLPGSTKVGTPCLEVVTTKRGVCQDFAHLAIACLRSLGLAVRYVSGYIATTSPPGKPRLTGADASHAWISVYSPDFGWVDFDPTNGVMPLDSHVTVAWGRDYDDVGPIRGVLVGGHRQRLEVSVDVVPSESAPAN
jgi:transglutaminase-like putative cysteine protease